MTEQIQCTRCLHSNVCKHSEKLRELQEEAARTISTLVKDPLKCTISCNMFEDKDRRYL